MSLISFRDRNRVKSLITGPSSGGGIVTWPRAIDSPCRTLTTSAISLMPTPLVPRGVWRVGRACT